VEAKVLYSEAEMNAIEANFSAKNVYICDFHREQAWERWCKVKNASCHIHSK